MKTTTCKQLGGTCSKEFSGNTFEEVAELAKQHGMEMFQKQDQPHLEAMNKMQKLMVDPQAMSNWMAERKKEFNLLPED